MKTKIFEYINTLTKASTPSYPIWHIEAIQKAKLPVWNYVDGCMMTALSQIYEITKDDTLLRYVKDYIDFFISPTGDILGFDVEKFSVDDVSASQNLFKLYALFKEEKYLKAIEKTYEQIKVQPRISTGNFIHKQIYDGQVWLDGLYMAMPFYAKYLSFHKIEMFDDIIAQYQNLRKLLYNHKDKLYHHAYDDTKSMFWADKESGRAPNYWLRSIGWLLASMADVYEYLKESRHQIILKGLFKECLEGILMYQEAHSKLFYNLPLYPKLEGNYLEVSGSALVSYAILKGCRLGALERDFEHIGQDIFNAITKDYLTKNEKGIYELKQICLVSGLGPNRRPNRDGSIAYYLSEPMCVNDAKGSGPYLMAFAENLRREHENISI